MDKKAQKPHIHPMTRIINDFVSIFTEMGFSVAQGPEMETEFNNFDALNVPKDHPSRDMQDTFWIKGRDGKVMRTHTSGVQIRYMLNNKPPFKIIVPGRVFRNEATDATHEAQFYQCEGLVVGENVTLANLKFTLETFLKKMYGDDVQIKLRPGYFPFVEPGVEIDMICGKCKGEGCPTCKYNGWIEVLGAGMVHPKVLSNVGIDPNKYSGFAFGTGLDRLAMLKYGIDDVRLMYSGDLRFINQF
ncbi:phenylalanine--tRNA ligase subunit alpha [Patescibacteria group bacterium]